MGKYLLKYDDEYSYQKKEQDLTYYARVDDKTFEVSASTSTEDGINYTLNVKTPETTGITPFEFSINVKGNSSGADGYIGLTLDSSGNLSEAKEITRSNEGVEKTVSGEEETMYLWECRYLDGTQFGWDRFGQVYTGNTEPLSLDENKRILKYIIYGIGDNNLPKTVNSIKPGVSYTIENKNVCYNPIIRYLTATYLIESANTQVSLYNPYGKFGSGNWISKSANPALLGANELDFIDIPNMDEEPTVTWRVVYMEIDGKQEEVHHLHTFETEGEHVVRFGIAMNDRVVPNGFFATYRPGQGGGGIESSNPNILGDVLPFDDSMLGETIDTSSLVKVDIPEGFNGIGAYCFYGTNLYSGVTMPSTMKKIGAGAFSLTSPTGVTFPDSIKEIGPGCFSDAKLIDIPEFPANIHKIPDKCFFGTIFTSPEPTIPSNISEIGNYAFCQSQINSAHIPSTVKKIGQGMLSGATFSSITIDEGVETIGGGFMVASKGVVREVNFPNSLREIGDGSSFSTRYSWELEGNNYLTSVTFGTGLKHLGESVFYECGTILNIDLPDGLEYIGDDCFSMCSGLTSFTIPSGVKHIGSGSMPLKVEGLVLPPSLEYIGSYAFNGYTASSALPFTLPQTVKYIGNTAFYKTVFSGDLDLRNVTHIGAGAFLEASGFSTVHFNESIETLGTDSEDSTYQRNGEVFKGCKCLTNIVLPNSLKVLETEMFSGCTNLTSITFGTNIEQIKYHALDDCPWFTNGGCEKYGNIYYPVPTIAYKAVTSAATSFTFKEGTKTIGEECFYNCKKFTSITIPNTVEIIGSYAFGFAEKLTAVTIPGSVKQILGHSHFRGCSALTSIVIEEGVTDIPDAHYCSSLTSVTLPSTINENSLGKYSTLFVNCVNLSIFNGNSPLISSDRKYLKNGGKLLCVAIKDNSGYTIPNDITEIGYGCFSNCLALTGVTFHENISVIHGDAFYYCRNLKRLTFYAQEPPKLSGYSQFYSLGANGTLYCPTNCTSNYNIFLNDYDYGQLGRSGWTIQEISVPTSNTP